MASFLFIDTSAAVATIALHQKGLPLLQLHHHQAMEQASVLSLLIEELCQKANISLAKLSAICVCAGPGSYTGLRVGLSTAKGIAYALDIPLLLFNRLDLLAAASAPGRELAVVLQARKEEYFLAHYAADRSLVLDHQHVFAADLATLLPASVPVLCDHPLPAALPNQQLVFDAQNGISIPHWLPLAEARYAAADFDDTAYSEPFYLKAAYTTLPKPR